MKHLLKYSLLHKLRDFSMVFWPFVFPLILGTLFYVSFGNLTSADFETVDAAIVINGDAEDFLIYLDELKAASPELLSITEMTAEEAEDALHEAKISGYFIADTEPALTVSSAGVAESILQSVLESFLSSRYTMQQIYDKAPGGLEAAIAEMRDNTEAVSEVSLGGETTNSNNQFFYSLIAMACLYGAFIGLGAAMSLQANITPLAARKCAASTGKLRLIISEFITSYGIHFLNVLILLLYLVVLGLSFGGHFGAMLLVILFGVLIGVSLGIFIGSLGKAGEGLKVAIILAISMIGSFLAGLMSTTVKHAVDRAAPLVNLINPAALISDAFYCINIYEDPSRLARDIGIPGAEAAIIMALSFIMVRRERYDSI